MGTNERIPKAQIMEQMNRILSTAAFKNSRILSGFLEFVVTETLVGREKDIKEYHIGVKALSRDIDFNPQLDSIVRIHAGRLRRVLKEYYYESGKNDTVRIGIPKGSYIPEFDWQKKPDPSEIYERIKLSRKKPVVAVLPFRNISKNSSRDFFADGLGETLSTELVRFSELSVISYYSSHHVAGKTSDLKEAARLLGAKYFVTGSVQNDSQHLRVSVQLILCENCGQLWAKTFNLKNSASGLFEIQNEIVSNILTAIGGYYGAIFRDAIKIPEAKETESPEVFDAVFLYYHYQKVYTADFLHKTIAALEAAVKADPNYALAWAMLAELYLDDRALDFRKIENPLAEGLKYAQLSLSIDPYCQHGYLALAWVYLFYRDKNACIKAVEQCIDINPNSSDMVGAMGFALVCAGEFERGYTLLKQSFQNNPFCPWWFKCGFVFYFLYEKDYQQALYWAEKISKPEILWEPLLKSAALAHLGRLDDARSSLLSLLQIVPDASNQLKSIVGSFLLSEDLNNEIMTGLTKAGLKPKTLLLAV